MSQFDGILSELKVNGIFSDPDYPEPSLEYFKGRNCYIQHAIQQLTGCPCPYCGNHGIRYGFKVCHIRMTDVFSIPFWVSLKKQRYRCSVCHRTYLPPSNLTDKGCYISNLIKQEIIRDATRKVSIKDIASNYQVSWPTVQRVIKSWYAMMPREFSFLPKVLGIDEFRAVSTLQGSKFAVTLIDGTRHEIFDICPDRKLGYLTKYFSQFSEPVRSGVEYVTTDMYDPYITVARRYFPNAKVCVDKFHVVQLASRALDRCRVEVMKSMDDAAIYKIFKHYWRLPLTAVRKVDGWKTLWVSHLQSYKTQDFLMEEMLKQSSVLQSTWEVYQSLLKAMEQNSPDKFLALITEKYEELHPQMRICLKTLKRYRKEIANTLKFGYTNAVTEATNNHIKVLKRVSYGYRNYENYRARILLVLGRKVEIAALQYLVLVTLITSTFIVQKMNETW